MESDPTISPHWLKDGIFRWLNVEGASPEEAEQLFNQLGVNGIWIADHINGEHWLNWNETEKFFIKACPAPTSWKKYESWFHLIGLSETIVTMHPVEIAPMENFIKTWWFDRPGPEPAADALLLHVVQCFVEEEIFCFNSIRMQVERHAEGLRLKDEAFSVEDLELLMTDCNHMSIVFFEYQALFSGIEFGRSYAIDLNAYRDLYRIAVGTIQLKIEGVESVQRRLAELQQQHLMDQQQKTDSRLRVLTIISAIFLPSTLIAGLYGMNFENMPGQHADYTYYIVLFVMFILGVVMIIYFVRKGWLN